MSKNVKIHYDDDNVYLVIKDISDCCFELWEIDSRKTSRVKIKIPMKEWKRIIKKEKKNESLQPTLRTEL